MVANRTPLHPLTTEAGAVFIDEAGWLVPAQFGDALAEYEAARSGAVVFDRSHHGKIEALGKDAAVFLHNLSTNDIKTLPPGSGCEAFFCTTTAKVASYAHVYRLPLEGKRERLWLDLTPGLAEKTYRHLDRYLISEDVTLTDHTAALAQVHLAGPGAAGVLAAALPDAEGAWPVRLPHAVLRHHGALRRSARPARL